MPVGTRAAGRRTAILLMVSASLMRAAAPVSAKDDDGLAAFLAPAAGERSLMDGAPGRVGEGAFWRWAAASGLGPRELRQAGLTGPELWELVCLFADDIDLARAVEDDAAIDSGRTLIERADRKRESLRRALQAGPASQTPDLPADVSARPECVLAPDAEDVAALLAEAPGAAPYLIERRLRQTVRRASSLRIVALPDVQHREGNAPRPRRYAVPPCPWGWP